MKKYEVADILMPSTTKRAPKRDISKINTVIIHTTGYGAGLERIANFNKGSLARIGSNYAYRMANILKFKGHFLIDHVGVIYHMIPLKEIAWHTASNKRKQLESSDPPAWWQKRWPFFKKPTDLACWAGYPNSNSVGIDLLAHGNGAITPGYTEKQYESLAKLVAALCKDLDISIKREYILGHEDVDPISRGTKTAGWDPGEKFDYDKFMAMVVTKTFAKEGDPESKPVLSLPKDSLYPCQPVIDLDKFTPLFSKIIKGFMGIFKK